MEEKSCSTCYYSTITSNFKYCSKCNALSNWTPITNTDEDRVKDILNAASNIKTNDESITLDENKNAIQLEEQPKNINQLDILFSQNTNEDLKSSFLKMQQNQFGMDSIPKEDSLYKNISNKKKNSFSLEDFIDILKANWLLIIIALTCLYLLYSLYSKRIQNQKFEAMLNDFSTKKNKKLKINKTNKFSKKTGISNFTDSSSNIFHHPWGNELIIGFSARIVKDLNVEELKTEFKTILNDLQNHRFNKTREAIKKLLEKYPDRDEVKAIINYILGEMFFIQNNPEPAKKYFKEVIKKYPETIIAKQSKLALKFIENFKKRKASFKAPDEDF